MSGTFTVNAHDFVSALELGNVTAAPKKDKSIHTGLYLSIAATEAPEVEYQGELSDEFLANAADFIPDDIDEGVDDSVTLSGAVLSVLGYSNAFTVGVATVPVSGTVDTPWILTPASIASIIKFLAAVPDKEMDIVVKIESQNITITSPVESQQLRLGILDTEEYKYDLALSMLNGAAGEPDVQDENGTSIPAGRLVALSPDSLKTISSVGSKVGEDVHIIPVTHPCSNILLECGTWRGAVLGSKYPADLNVDSPNAELFLK